MSSRDTPSPTLKDTSLQTLLDSHDLASSPVEKELMRKLSIAKKYGARAKKSEARAKKSEARAKKSEARAKMPGWHQNQPDQNSRDQDGIRNRRTESAGIKMASETAGPKQPGSRWHQKPPD